MTDDEATAIYDDPQREAACVDYLKASVQVERAISKDVDGDDSKHEAQPAMLAALLAAEVVFLNTHWWNKDWPEEAQRTVKLCVICNDVFAWACADAEELDYREITDLYDHWMKDPDWGPAIWCIKKRNQMPQGPVVDRIRAAGIWDLDQMNLPSNTQNAQVQAVFDAARSAAKDEKKD
jgi:hypothetical protein